MDKIKAAVIYLASGNSKRFGQENKLLQMIGKANVSLWIGPIDRSMQRSWRVWDHCCHTVSGNYEANTILVYISLRTILDSQGFLLFWHSQVHKIHLPYVDFEDWVNNFSIFFISRLFSIEVRKIKILSVIAITYLIPLMLFSLFSLSGSTSFDAKISRIIFS